MCTIAELGAGVPNAIAGGPFGSELGRADYVDPAEGVPVIRGANLGAGERRFYTDDLVFISRRKAEALARHTARPGDVVVTQRGTLEQVGLVPDDTPWERFILSQSQMKVTCDPTLADPEYLYYWLLTPESRDYVARHAITTGVPHTNLAILRATPVRLPPLPQQRAIARALGCVDARAALAEDMHDELDRLIRLVFRTWFIDHVPAYSRRDGERHPSTDEAEAALFPDDVVGGPAGRAPKGWPLVPLTQCADFQNGSPFSAGDLCERGRGRPIVKITEIKRGESAQTQYALAPSRGRAIDTGDILMSWSGNPHTSLGTFLWTGGPGWLNQHIFKVVPPAPHWRTWVYCLLRELQPRFVEYARSKQTTGLGHVTQADMRQLLVPRPPDALAAAFERRMGPAFQRMLASGMHGRVLARARQHLLVQFTRGLLTAPE
jgi:type I restriction enzyme S subunit